MTALNATDLTQLMINVGDLQLQIKLFSLCMYMCWNVCATEKLKYGTHCVDGVIFTRNALSVVGAPNGRSFHRFALCMVGHSFHRVQSGPSSAACDVVNIAY